MEDTSLQKIHAMISGLDTTADWQQYSTNVAVLPVGAFEQHGTHLPLDTDVRGSEYFARVIAQEMDGALLPALPFGTSLEHAGFRGTVTLRPETLMRLLQDIARDLEAQAFRILIIVNGHGGNFCLGPAVREWNRTDRALKILLVHWWEFCDPALTSNAVLDVHAGDFETSVMLAIAPDLVRAERIHETATRPHAGDEEIPLRQSDLNSFGVGHFSLGGAIGDASQATAEKGHAIVAAVRENMLAFVRDRLARLAATPRYSGRGGLAIRTLQESDLDAALRLKEIVNWNQTPRDLRLFLTANPRGNYAAVHNGHVIGTTATIRYAERIAWIGLVIVDPDFRGVGVGRMLLQAALEGLRDVPCIKLDATPDGQKLYSTLGFVDESTLQRWICPAVRGDATESEGSTHTLCRAVPGDLDAIVELDAQTFGARRPVLMQSLLEATPFAWCLTDEDNEVVGFCLGREGTRFYQIGPLIADGFAAAHTLLAAVLHELNGRAALIDVPDSQTALIAELQRLGFTSQRPLIRMRCGTEYSDVRTQRLFAICGPEFG
jgi:creatinine amidohydrolase